MVSEYFSYLAKTFIVLAFTSCTTSRFQNFNQRKYLKLEKMEVKEELALQTPTRADDEIEIPEVEQPGADTLWFMDGSKKAVEIADISNRSIAYYEISDVNFKKRISVTKKSLDFYETDNIVLLNYQDSPRYIKRHIKQNNISNLSKKLIGTDWRKYLLSVDEEEYYQRKNDHAIFFFNAGGCFIFLGSGYLILWLLINSTFAMIMIGAVIFLLAIFLIIQGIKIQNINKGMIKAT